MYPVVPAYIALDLRSARWDILRYDKWLAVGTSDSDLFPAFLD